MRTIQIYRTYSFKDKDPAIDMLRTAIKDEGATYKEIHETSDVSVSSLKGWFDGKTRRPHHATMAAVAGALGYDFKLVKQRGRSAVEKLKRKSRS